MTTLELSTQTQSLSLSRPECRSLRRLRLNVTEDFISERIIVSLKETREKGQEEEGKGEALEGCGGEEA